MSYWTTINEQFPVRKTQAQKEAFRTWAMDEMKRLGYRPKTEVNGRGKHRNIVAGDPEHAAFLFTAHYDTPARMLLPNLLIPCNIPVFLLYQLLNVLLLLFPAAAALVLVQGLFGVPRLSWAAFLAVYLGLLLLLTRGPANPHNANDNTSGVAALLMLMERLPENVRGRSAFILFDDEEKGRAGSKSYAKEHLQVMYTRLTFNLDSVGVGEWLVCGVPDLARKCTGYGAFERAVTSAPGRQVRLCNRRGFMITSDHSAFKCGVGLIMCRRRPLIGFYTPALHTRRDTLCQEDSLEWLTAILARVAGEMGTAGETEAE